MEINNCKKIVILFSILSIILISFFTYYTYENKKHDLYAGMDEKLLVTAISMTYLFYSYHDKYNKDHLMKEKAFQNMAIKLNWNS